MTPHERHVTAIHEAGHAVVGAVLGLPMRHVSVVETSRSMGRHILAQPAGDFEPQQLAQWRLAGSVAERWCFPGRDERLIRRNAAADFDFVRTLLDATGQPGDDVDEAAAHYERLTEAIVISHEAWITAVAAYLLRHGWADENTVRDLEPV